MSYRLPEMAKELMGRESDIPKNPPYNIYEIPEFIFSSREVVEELNKGRFCQDESGHAEIEAYEASTGDKSPDHIDTLVVMFVDPEGKKTKLGKTFVVQEDACKTGHVVAFADKNGLIEKEIEPTDPRWETIIGTIREAVQECKQDRTSDQSNLVELRAA